MSPTSRSPATAGEERFFEVGNPPINLLRVMPGVPEDLVFEQISILLGYIRHLVREGDMTDDHKLLGAADYLSALARALIDDLEIARSPMD
ncbi:DUF3077 domain-containing protein [Pseudomonas sichuanensis]|uniref:DUF3077 domain-containing protein n=1 Tax=Pseudomonas sichuanensis TaxID=2213015 RepID=A0ABV0DJX8_9PSED